MAENELKISDRRENAFDENFILIQDIIRSSNKSSYMDTKKMLSNAQINDWPPFSIYNAVWKHIMFNRKGALIELILLYNGLENKIHSSNTDILKVDVKEQKYKVLFKDINKNLNVDVEFVSEDTVKLPRYSKMFFKDFVLTIVLLFNQVIWLLYSLVIEKPSLPETVIFPSQGREYCIRPVIEYLQNQFIVEQTTTRISWFRNNCGGSWNNVDRLVRDRHITLKGMSDEISFFLKTFLDIYIHRSLERQLKSELSENVNLKLPYTIEFAVNKGLQGNIHSLVHVVMLDDLFSRNEIKRVVVGGNSPRMRAINDICKQKDINVHYIPHSIVHPKELFNKGGDISKMYVSGEFSKQYLQKHFNKNKLPEIDPSGRPYLQNLLNDITENLETGDNKKFQATIATQKGEDRVREKFVRTSLQCLVEHKLVDEIIIKTHPNEDATYYRDIISSYSKEYQDKIKIKDSGLEQVLQKSALVITINSNVGLESILNGTPCITYNEWMPIIPSFPYVEDGPVPVFESETELEMFFNELCLQDLKTLQSKQKSFGRDAYFPDGNAAKKIARSIENN